MLEALKKSQEMVHWISSDPGAKDVDPQQRKIFNEKPYFLRLLAAYIIITKENKRIDVRLTLGLIRVLALVNFVIADDYGKEVKQLKRAMKKARAPIGEGKR